MIRPNELRLGNKFRMIGGQMVQTVFEIIDNTDRNRIQFESAEHKEMYRVIVTCEENRNQYKPFEMEPIPLDESWLLRFGFTRCTDNTSWHEFKSLAVSASGAISIAHRNAWNNASTKVQYVHQLQNIYFALTGEELELKA